MAAALRWVCLFTLIATSEALACPDCPTAQLVQTSVFDHRFASHLFLISLPLLVLGVISGLLYRIGIDERRGAR